MVLFILPDIERNMPVTESTLPKGLIFKTAVDWVVSSTNAHGEAPVTSAVVFEQGAFEGVRVR